MSNTPSPIVEVAVGILLQPDGRALFAQRPAGKPYAGYWEFPGGKVEAGESVLDALKREFAEELDVQVQDGEFWQVIEHVYPHAHVRLHFYLVRDWRGEPRGLEGQAFAWYGRDYPEPLLPATIPLMPALDARRFA